MLYFLPDSLGVSVPLVLAAILILWKSADWFVEGAVGVARKLRVPPMLVGIVLVSLATTSPELMASMLAAVRGVPEVALGNAVGSVLVDASVALGLAAVVAPIPLAAHPAIFRSGARFLVFAMLLLSFFVFDGTLGRLEGATLVGAFAIYTARTYWKTRRGQGADDPLVRGAQEEVEQIDAALEQTTTGRILLLFFVGFAGVLLGSECLLKGATGIALYFGMPPVVLGLTVVAIGTSVPEIATVVASALKGQSGVGVGNVIGADILNICWVAGMSAVANPLSTQMSVVLLMFPAMFVIVLTMLAMLRWKYNLVRWNGAVLLSLYVVFVTAMLTMTSTGVIEPLPVVVH